MGDWIRRNAVTIFIVAIVLFVLWAISLPNYIRVKGRSGGYATGMAYPEEDAAMAPAMQGELLAEPGINFSRGAGAAGSDKSASMGYFEGEAPQTTAVPPGNGQPPGVSVVDSALEESGLLAKLDSWMLPEAYAQDHEVDERYLVREGNCSLEVDSYKAAADKVSGLARKYDGMVSDTHSTKNYDETVEGWIKIRVPADKFFDAWNEILEIGEVQDETISSQDVSRQYVGYVSRLKNLMAEQATLQQMLEEALAVQRSRGLGEGYSILLDTQERLFEVTGQIESTEDQLNALADRVTRSTITVSLREAKPLKQQVKEEFSWGLGTTAGTAYQDLLRTLRGMAQGFVYFIITCWTWLIPLLIVLMIARWAWRRWITPQLRKPSQPAPAGPQQE
ncbi:MAG TPA: DUF4349 domain-containing protein [Firmicutes bacterium]|nr:DUF4349 domain-containing protein [Bacillota bacterium]